MSDTSKRPADKRTASEPEIYAARLTRPGPLPHDVRGIDSDERKLFEQLRPRLESALADAARTTRFVVAAIGVVDAQGFRVLAAPAARIAAVVRLANPHFGKRMETPPDRGHAWAVGIVHGVVFFTALPIATLRAGGGR